MVKVGDKATYYVGSDRYPYEVIYVSDGGKKIRLREMRARIVNGSAYDGSAMYEYSSDPDGVTMEATLRKDGRWRRVGVKRFGGSVSIGEAHKYLDPHF